ncbi:hypothetical protein VNO77_33882 [Canavalia gladiata]|uniref:Uncharacterized protein n=1 Tax=Canavalia gladiata TaxID=3824 RepID=A0AAN9KFA2_CANGL
MKRVSVEFLRQPASASSVLRVGEPERETPMPLYSTTLLFRVELEPAFRLLPASSTDSSLMQLFHGTEVVARLGGNNASIEFQQLSSKLLTRLFHKQNFPQYRPD